MEDTKNPPPQAMEDEEKKEEQGKEEEPKKEEQQPASTTTPKSGGGWGGWGFSAFSVLSHLQKAATVAAEENARNLRFIFLFLNICLCISDVAEAYQAAIKSAAADSHEALPRASILEKANSFSEHLCSDQTTAVSKIQDGLQYLSYVVLSTSMRAA
ncbi:uncharacterized protein LOC111298715 [Durio zibethinus]|uniref:Uncharacterized protein LOC111298715 n=1 Tax=Durio zibethinus TaxID=66656 RepID=A0A6P5Z9T9_DURZI|nr:uncharacterized protein LOC111298715 [Durio zibethinus]